MFTEFSHHDVVVGATPFTHAHTYIPIPINILLNFHYDFSRQGLEILYRVSSSPVFSFVSYMHIHINVLAEAVFPRIITMMTFVGSQSFISLPSFMFVSSAVSDI